MSTRSSAHARMSVRQGSNFNGAVLSDDGLYRYRLWRSVGGVLAADRPDSGVCFVMLNPSTADFSTDDPTIRRCLGFARRWGFGHLEVVNVFAWRSTDPKALKWAGDPVGPENDCHVVEAVLASDRVVLAYGSSTPSHWKPQWLYEQLHAWHLLWRLEGRPEVVALEVLKNGGYRHPLYARYDQEPVVLLRSLRRPAGVG